MTSDDSFSNLGNRAKRGFGGGWYILALFGTLFSGGARATLKPGWGYVLRCFGGSVGGDKNFTTSPANLCKWLIEHLKLYHFFTLFFIFPRIPVCVTGPRQTPSPDKAGSAHERERATRGRKHRSNQPPAPANKMSKNGKPGSKKSAVCS